MKKITILAGILGGTVLVLLAVTVVGLIWGAGILRDRLPAWVNGGEEIIRVAMTKAEEVLPGAKERIRELAPGLMETVEKVAPGFDLPRKDVGGEDIEPIPRYGNMVRVSFLTENQKRTVAYKGRVDCETAKDFYRKEMATLGFQEKALKASPGEEVYQYKKGNQHLEFRFKNIVSLSKITELTIREL